MQSFLGIEKTEEEKMQECVDKLRAQGYVVISPQSLDGTSVKNPTGLVDLFYSLLQYHHQNRKIHYSKATKKDVGLAKMFLNNRMSIKGNKKEALKECAAIVRCVVENEDLFGFSEPLHSFDCFGNDMMKWVIDRAISIINGENEAANERDFVLLMEELDDEHEKESLSCLDDRIKELKGFLGEIDDGEEEKQ